VESDVIRRQQAATPTTKTKKRKTVKGKLGYSEKIHATRARNAEWLALFDTDEPRVAPKGMTPGALVRRGYLKTKGMDGRVHTYIRTAKEYVIDP
jgi:hypothetical protein